MTTTTHMGMDFAHTPHRVMVDLMDRAVRMAEDAKRMHDLLAFEVGFDRVRISGIEPGDEIPTTGGDFAEVEKIRLVVDEIASWFEVTYTSGVVETFDDGQLVSRRRAEIAEPF